MEIIMCHWKITAYALLPMSMVLVSCVAPKATVIAPPPVVKNEEKKLPEPTPPEPMLPGLPDDGNRMPDMLVMPGEGEFRSTKPVAPKTGTEAGAVISRPPTDPPLRVKPKPAGEP
jgi:hypothetical protein